MRAGDRMGNRGPGVGGGLPQERLEADVFACGKLAVEGSHVVP